MMAMAIRTIFWFPESPRTGRGDLRGAQALRIACRGACLSMTLGAGVPSSPVVVAGPGRQDGVRVATQASASV